jgi:2-dehydropantoate 2-reductase
MMTGNWHVLGAGAQGLLFYAYACKAEQSWTLVARQCPANQPLIYQLDQQLEFLPLRCTTLNECHAITQIIVCVKTTQIESTLAELASHLPPNATVVLALNGVSWLNLLDRLLPTQHILLLSSTHGSFRPQPFHVVDSGRAGKLMLGPGPRAPLEGPALAKHWDRFGLNCRWHDDILARMWHKAAINSCINPLTALLNCRNGELLVIPRAQTYMPRIIDELTAILACSAWPLAAESLHDLVEATCRITACNYSSMQQDFRHHRETEIDTIVGAFIEQAQRVGLSCPTLHLVRDAIKTREDWSHLGSELKRV